MADAKKCQNPNGTKGGQECPAIAELKAALLANVPLLGSSPGKIGTIQEGPSRHHAGLAMDIMLDSKSKVEKPVADRIVQALVACHPQMQWFDLLYVDWNESGQPFYFHIPGNAPFGGKHLQKNRATDADGVKHVDHIHVDWCLHPGDVVRVYEWPPQACNDGFADALAAELRTS